MQAARSECVPSNVATFLLLRVPKSPVNKSTLQGIDTFNIDATSEGQLRRDRCSA